MDDGAPIQALGVEAEKLQLDFGFCKKENGKRNNGT